MTEEITLKAKELVNSFYQPLGFLICGVGVSDMWEYAKDVALKTVETVEATGALVDRSCGFLTINPTHTEYWKAMKEAINDL